MGAITLAAKYMIVAQIEIGGNADRSDIVGALFSQTEGILGREMDLRDLQLTGRIGRIEVDIVKKDERTIAKIYVPSNLDRYETALVAAMLEAVERVGPYPAKLSVLEIRDLREEKRKRVLERARQLVKLIEQEVLPDTKEILEQLKEEVAEKEIIEYGPERLPAGPEVDKADTVIIVEGRADVVNLVKHGFRNVIALEGISKGVPKTVIELSKRKTTIAFVDGDRGGEMVLSELLKVAHVDYIAKAPPGKEVEQLTGKEINKALKNKVSVNEYLAQQKRDSKEAAETRHEEGVVVEVQTPQSASVPAEVAKSIDELRGTLEAVLYDEEWREMARVPVRDLPDMLQKIERAHAILMDGIVTQRIVELSAGKGIKKIIAARVGPLTKLPEDLEIATFEQVAHG